MKAKYPVMFNKLKRDKGMVYVMEAIEAAVQALLDRNVHTIQDWRTSKERAVVKERVAWLAAFAGNIPSTQKAARQFYDELAAISQMRSELMRLLFLKVQKAHKKKS